MRDEPLDWVCAKNSRVWTQDTLPIALFEEGCPDRDIMTRALTLAKRDYRVEFESYSYSGMVAALESGLVVAALSRSTVPVSLMRLGPSQGVPKLPTLNVVAARQCASSEEIDALFYSDLKAHLQSEEQAEAEFWLA